MMAPVAIIDIHLTAPRLSSAFLQGSRQAKPAHDSICESTHGVGRGFRQGLPGEARNGMLDPAGGNHELSWHRRAQPDKRVVIGRRAGAAGKPWQDGHDGAGLG